MRSGWLGDASFVAGNCFLRHNANLTLLSPRIREAILTGELRASERRLQRVVAEAEWGR